MCCWRTAAGEERLRRQDAGSEDHRTRRCNGTTGFASRGWGSVAPPPFHRPAACRAHPFDSSWGHLSMHTWRLISRCVSLSKTPPSSSPHQSRPKTQMFVSVACLPKSVAFPGILLVGVSRGWTGKGKLRVAPSRERAGSLVWCAHTGAAHPFCVATLPRTLPRETGGWVPHGPACCATASTVSPRL